MKPSKESVEKLRPAFHQNTELIVECFEDFVNATCPDLGSQPLTDMLFVTFCDGIIEVMSPSSKLNRNWNISNILKEKK